MFFKNGFLIMFFFSHDEKWPYLGPPLRGGIIVCKAQVMTVERLAAVHSCVGAFKASVARDLCVLSGRCPWWFHAVNFLRSRCCCCRPYSLFRTDRDAIQPQAHEECVQEIYAVRTRARRRSRRGECQGQSYGIRGVAG